MPFDVKGITIEIGADATKLTEAIRKIEASYSGLNKVASELDRSMAMPGANGGTIQSYVIQQQLLAEKISRTREEITEVQKAIDTFPEQVRSWQVGLVGTTTRIDELADEIVEASDATAKEIVELEKAETAYKDEAQAAKELQAALTNHNAGVKDTSKEQSKLKAALDKTTKSIAEQKSELSYGKAKVQELESANQRLAQTVEDLRGKQALAESQLAGYQAEVSATTTKLSTLRAAYRDSMISEEDFDQETKALNEKLKEQQGICSLAKSEVQNYANQIKSANSQIENNKKAIEKGNATIEKQERALDKAAKEQSSYRKALKKVVQEEENSKKTKEQLQAELDQQTQKAKEAKQAYENQKEAVKRCKDAEKELSDELSRQHGLRNQYERNLDNQGKSLTTLKAKLETLENTMKSLRSEFSGTEDSWNKFSRGLEIVSDKADKAATVFDNLAQKARLISGISIAGLGISAKEAIDFEDAFAGVRKTVDGTEEQFQAIDEALEEMATTTASSYEELAKYAELGGQMGVGVENIASFTKTIAMLGDTTNLVGEEGAQSIAKFANIMSKEFSETDDWYNRFGSTVVDLGNNFATTEADIVEGGIKIASAGQQIGMSSDQILALSTALSSLGLKSAEAGGATSKMMQKIAIAVATGNDNLEQFASASGKTVDEFVQAWQEDAPTAFLEFLESISQAEDGSERLQKLAEAGFDSEIRTMRVAGALTGSIDLYKDALDTASTAWKDNTAMVEEAEKRYGTTASQLKQAKEELKQVARSLGESLLPVIKEGVKKVREFADWFKNLSDEEKQAIVKTMAFTAAVSPVFSILSKTTKMFSQSLKYIKKFGDAMGRSSVSMSTWVPLSGLAIGMAAAIGATVKATQDWVDELDKAVRQRDPALDMFDALTDEVDKHRDAMTQAADRVKALKENYEDTEQKTETYKNKIENLNSVENLNTAQKAELKNALDKLKEIYPDLDWVIDENTGHVMDSKNEYKLTTDEIEKTIDAMKRAAQTQALSSMMEAQSEALLESEQAYQANVEALETINSRLGEIKSKYPAGVTISDPEDAHEFGQILEDLKTASVNMQQLTTDTQEQREEMERLANATETGGDFSKWGESLKTTASEMIARVEELGVQIPENLKKGIEDGSMSVNDGIAMAVSLENLAPALSGLDEVGREAVSKMANSIITDAPTVQDAVDQLNYLISFATLAEQGGYTGEEIVSAMAGGVINNSQAYGDAVWALDQYTNEYFENARNGAQTAGEQLSTSFGQAAVNSSKEVKGAVGGMKKSLNELPGAGSKAGKFGDNLNNTSKSGIDKSKNNISTIKTKLNELPGAGTQAGVFGANLYNQARYSLDSVQAKLNTIRDTLGAIGNTHVNPTITTTQKTRFSKESSVPADYSGMSARSALAAYKAANSGYEVQTIAARNSAVMMPNTGGEVSTAGAIQSLQRIVGVLSSNGAMRILQQIADNTAKGAVIVADGTAIAKVSRGPLESMNNRKAKFINAVYGGAKG